MKRSTASRPRLPEGTRLYAVGDVHGRLDLLTELHQKIRDDAAMADAPRNIIVYLGDYIDRGPDSRGVIDALLAQPLPGFTPIFLSGNHEVALKRFLVDHGSGAEWLGFGGAETLASYGLRPPLLPVDPADLNDLQARFQAALPPQHRRFYANLQPYWIEGDFMLVHAGIRPGLPPAQQVEDDLFWIRTPFLRHEGDFGKFIIHGHTISESPDVKSNRIGIDTGAYYSGRLTALVAQGRAFSFLQTGS